MKEPKWLTDARAEGRILGDSGTTAKPSKYRNRKVELQGHKFDSQKEANRYVELGRLQKMGLIDGLQLQKKFPLRVNGVLVCTYVADFAYEDRTHYLEVDGEEQAVVVVEDVKSEFTRKNPVYRIKAKLMKAIYGITIRET